MFNDFLEALQDSPFEETPVDAKTFVESSDYLGQPSLSDTQYEIVEAMSQIYKKADLELLMGDVEGSRYYDKYTKNEIILQLGKGSGKDFTSTVGPVLEALEEHVVLLRLFGEAAATDSLMVRIGHENPVEELQRASVVTVGYGSGDQALATLGILGPTRMDYAGSMGAVSAVARYVGQILKDQ